jgi:hypothetical protein
LIETFTGKRVRRRHPHLEVRDIGPNPHVTEAVIANLPKEKAVFVFDLFTIQQGLSRPSSTSPAGSGKRGWPSRRSLPATDASAPWPTSPPLWR